MERIIIWALILAVSIIVECSTTALVSIWFAPSAAVCIILELCGVKNIYIQIVVFIVLSALIIFLMRKKIKQSFKAGKAKTNVDSLLGKTATVEEDILAGRSGRVNVGGMSWAAFSESEEDILAGETVKILAVSGVKLCCVPAKSGSDLPTQELVGKKARVQKRIDNFAATGTVLCEGKVYLAGAVAADIIEEGAIVRISAVEEARVLCKLLPPGAEEINQNSRR